MKYIEMVKKIINKSLYARIFAIHIFLQYFSKLTNLYLRSCV